MSQNAERMNIFQPCKRRDPVPFVKEASAARIKAREDNSIKLRSIPQLGAFQDAAVGWSMHCLRYARKPCFRGCGKRPRRADCGCALKAVLALRWKGVWQEYGRSREAVFVMRSLLRSVWQGGIGADRGGDARGRPEALRRADDRCQCPHHPCCQHALATPPALYLLVGGALMPFVVVMIGLWRPAS